MNIINERVDIIGQVSLGAAHTLNYCRIYHKGDNGIGRPCIILIKGDGVNKTFKAFFVVDSEFEESFIKPIVAVFDAAREKKNFVAEVETSESDSEINEEQLSVVFVNLRSDANTVHTINEDSNE